MERVSGEFVNRVNFQEFGIPVPISVLEALIGSAKRACKAGETERCDDETISDRLIRAE